MSGARTFERVRCPGCQRVVAAYVPHGGDGAGLRLVSHRVEPTRAGLCVCSECVIVPNGQGGWKVDA